MTETVIRQGRIFALIKYTSDDDRYLVKVEQDEEDENKKKIKFQATIYGNIEHMSRWLFSPMLNFRITKSKCKFNILESYIRNILMIY